VFKKDMIIFHHFCFSNRANEGEIWPYASISNIIIPGKSNKKDKTTNKVYLYALGNIAPLYYGYLCTICDRRAPFHKQEINSNKRPDKSESEE
jgi:hypothetical protein